MRVILAASALPGLRATQTREVARNAWLSVRPEDHVEAYAVSDGVPQQFVGAGIDEVLLPGAEQIERGGPGERRFAYREGATVVLDYTEVLAGVPGAGYLTSRIVGEDLRWAAQSVGLSQVYLALPAAGCVADGGLAFLEAVASDEPKSSAWGFRQKERPEVSADNIEQWLIRGRERTRHLAITVLAPAEQRMVGLSGVARSWMQAGLSPEAAQLLERSMGEIASALDEAIGAVGSPDLLGARPSSRDVYSGVGAMGLALAGIGARIFPTGDVTARPFIAQSITEADLVVYVCAAIGEDLPSGLVATIAEATRVGCAVVVVYETGSLRKGELPNLGIHGAYELRPGFDLAASPPETTDISGTLSNMMTRVARTWGW